MINLIEFYSDPPSFLVITFLDSSLYEKSSNDHGCSRVARVYILQLCAYDAFCCAVRTLVRTNRTTGLVPPVRNNVWADFYFYPLFTRVISYFSPFIFCDITLRVLKYKYTLRRKYFHDTFFFYLLYDAKYSHVKLSVTL